MTSKAFQLARLGNAYSDGALSNRNKIINGSMVIDQRNGGASVTLNSGTTYTLDRWFYFANGVNKFTYQQNAGSVALPTGFTKYMGFTVAAAVTIGASDYYITAQRIEGFNVADLGWGTAYAKSITISFWVRSSLTGTFGASVQNGASNRSYPFTYTISAANTWEQKTVTIAGDTSGTWATDNTGSLTLWYGLGVGSTLSGTAGSWSGSDYRSTTGATSVVGTSGATFYLTGVQLEVGDTATPFEHPRSYGDELARCKRYYHKMANPMFRGVELSSWSARRMGINFFPVMRAAPTVTLDGTLRVYNGTASGTVTSSNLSTTWSTVSSFDFDSNIGALSGTATGNACVAYTSTSGVVECYAVMDAEL